MAKLGSNVLWRTGWAIAITTLLALAACQKREAAQEAGVEAHGGNEPSIDAMCAEHGVLEAVCPKCNPALVAVFQAKGDWCAEHGFAESFCPICHPERGGRPAAELTREEPPADGTKIRFRSHETARRAGIETTPAVPSLGGSVLEAVAQITYDATRVAHVNARFPGVLRAIHVEVGSHVRQGAPLAVIESASVGADRSRLVALRARLENAEAAWARAKELHDRGVVPEKDVLEAQQELEAARAELTVTERSLRVAGPEGPDGTYTLTAPLGGVVTQRGASLGELVDPEELLFEVVDPSHVWAEIQVHESDVAAVQIGQPVVLLFDALGEREFPARIDYVAPSLDPRTRTVMARARLANPDGVLRAHLYGRARIGLAETQSGVSVPRSAVQQARGVPVVFVRLADDLYETRRVQLGSRDHDQVTLRYGVRAGELVVTQGSFLLKTETLKESIGAGCCDIQEN